MRTRSKAVRRQRSAGVALRAKPLLVLAAMLGLTLVVFAASGVASAARSAAPPIFAAACGTKPVTMEGYFETGFPDIVDLTNEFTRQHPSVKWHIRQDQFAVITQNAPLTLSGPNAPDLMRLPQVSGLKIPLRRPRNPLGNRH